jgi:glutamate formiminotransferase / formiminotetrahydrofolate cyclodeaminase
MSKLVECVPNFSEGRDRKVIDAITAQIASVADAVLLDVDPGAATNRTVVTFVGPPEAVVEAAFLAAKRAAELIDMRSHQGAHPRQGATDVCPIVPVSGVTVEECVELARRLGGRIGGELGIPVYLYESAATRPERKNLADIRAGEYEALPEKLARPEWRPDFGPAEFNARSGATVVGVRPFLIAYNVNLNTKEVRIARDIGLTMREKGRAKRDEQGQKVRDDHGDLVRVPGLPACRATGWFISEYGRAQVTMNLLDYAQTPIHAAFEKVDELARAKGLRATGSEIVGLVPKASILEAGRHFLEKQGASRGVCEREILENAVVSLGLNDVAPFEPAQKIIEYRVAARRRLASLPLTGFVEALGSSSPAPGGGSVSALAASMSAGLSSMVASLTYGKKGYTEHDAEMDAVGVRAQAEKDALLDAVDDDTAAFDALMAAFRLPKGTPEKEAEKKSAVEAAAKGAALVPLSVLERCPALLELAAAVEAKGNQNSLSDAGVSALQARAAAQGAYYNVLINLKSLEDAAFVAETRARADRALARADALARPIETSVMGKLRAGS